MTTPTPHGARLDLPTVYEKAKLYASIAASPHHMTFTVDALRSLIDEFTRAAVQQAAGAVPEGEIVVTKTDFGAIVAVTRQDSDGRILEVIAQDTQTGSSGHLAACDGGGVTQPLTEALLYEHEDGRYAVNPHTSGDPKWHRLGPVAMPDRLPVAWSRTRYIYDNDEREIGLDEPEVCWTIERPDGDGWLPLFDEPQVAIAHHAVTDAEVRAAYFASHLSEDRGQRLMPHIAGAMTRALEQFAAGRANGTSRGRSAS